MTPPRNQRTVDWSALGRRLLAAEAAPDAASEMARGKALLEERARMYAPAPVAAHDAGRRPLVAVRLAKESYAFDAADVREVFGLAELARLPGAEAPVFGLTTWRGELLLLLDIRSLLGLSAAALNDLRHVVVVARGPAMVGVVVDAALGMTSASDDEMVTADMKHAPAPELVRGVTSDALIVLETTALLRVLE